MVYLTKLRAQSLRGLPRSWPDLSIAERGIVIAGDNGVGKSSIIDALEYSLTGRSTLYPMNRLGVSWDKGSPHVRDGLPSVSVEVDTKDGRIQISPRTPLDSLPDEARAWAMRARQSTFVLRRHMLVDFVNCEPSKRYSSLEPFLNLSDYDGVENALKTWLDDRNTVHASLKSENSRLDASLRAIFKVTPDLEVSEDRLLSSLNLHLRELNLADCRTTADLPNIRAAVEAQLGGEVISQRLSQLGALRNALEVAGLPNSLLPIIHALKEAAHSLDVERRCLGRQILEDWLTRGRAIVDSSLAEECPLCEQPIERRSLLARLDERIDQERTVANARALVEERRRALLIPGKSMLQSMQRVYETWKQLFVQVPEPYADAVALLKDVVAAAESHDIQLTDLAAIESRASASLASHSVALRTVEAEILAEGGGARRARLLAARDMIDGLTSTLTAHRVSRERLERVQYECSILSRLHGHAVDTRKKAVQALFDRIAIIGWDIGLGPRFAKFGSDLEKLTFGKPEDMQPEDVAASAGRLLEGTLRNLTESLEIAVPAKFEKPYTIGDLWPPLCKACKKQKGFVSAEPGLTERLDSTYWVRNACGAHPDLTTVPVTNREIFEFRDALLTFLNATLCPSCNTSISKGNNGDWRCECGRLLFKRTLERAQATCVRTQTEMFSGAPRARGES